MGGVGALRGALTHEPGLLQARERQIEKTVGAAVLGEALAEVGQHAVVKARIVQLHGQGVLEIDAAADRFRCLAVRQAEQELQHTRSPVGRARCGGVRRAGTSPRSPRRTTARRGGLSPTSPLYHPGCSPARSARSETGLAHRNGDGVTTDTSTTASVFEAAPSMPADHADAPGNSKIPDRVKLRWPRSGSEQPRGLRGRRKSLC